MSTMRALVVYYSRSGHTRQVAEALAQALGADVEELHDPTERRGVLGYLRSGLEAALEMLAPIRAPEHDPSSYDLVVVGGPVWGGVPSPIRTYLWLERARLPRTAFLVTYGGFGAERVLEQMGALAGKKPVATLALREREMREHGTRASAFAEVLVAGVRRKIAARRGRPRAIGRR